MVSETFINLSDEKKQKIEGALLKEFSTYPLAKAQVARIVKDAGDRKSTRLNSSHWS